MAALKNPPYLTVDEAAERLCVCREQVVQLIRNFFLPAINVGLSTRKPRYRIEPQALEQFLAARRFGAKPAARSRRAKQINVIKFFE